MTLPYTAQPFASIESPTALGKGIPRSQVKHGGVTLSELLSQQQSQEQNLGADVSVSHEATSCL